MYDDSIKLIFNILKNKGITSVIISCEDGDKIVSKIENIQISLDEGYLEIFLNGNSKNPLFISSQHIVSIQKA